MSAQNLQKQKGFTLVEIAIVLVIIGLLLGGVLKGQELITNSKIKSVTKDLEGTATAYYAYQDRVGVVAGDTDANGSIDDNQSFWNDLRSQGFISGASGASAPTHALDGILSALRGGTATGTVLAGKNMICASGIEDTIANGMDRNFDDGDATTGTMQSGADATPTVALAYSATGALVTVCREL
ncbi:MAG: hypothetical protein ISEC1_P1511 [Thiomicrorhabdus sp.]|nr:MAG: hypothetical protein ISEC1_P1511 [Thiomicrorhabdus sp.]